MLQQRQTTEQCRSANSRYLGSGDVNLATNRTRDSTDTRMLRVAGDGTIAGADTATALEYLYELIGLNGK